MNGQGPATALSQSPERAVPKEKMPEIECDTFYECVTCDSKFFPLGGKGNPALWKNYGSTGAELCGNSRITWVAIWEAVSTQPAADPIHNHGEQPKHCVNRRCAPGAGGTGPRQGHIAGDV